MSHARNPFIAPKPDGVERIMSAPSFALMLSAWGIGYATFVPPDHQTARTAAASVASVEARR